MRVTAPVTDYIRASVMSVRGDLAVRGALVPERLAAGADKTYLQGKGAGVIPAYDNQMPPLTTKGDLIVQGTLAPGRIPTTTNGKVLYSPGAGLVPGYRSLFNLLTTQGDIWIWGASGTQRLAAGALDTYFKAQGAGNLPIYEKLALRDTGVKIGNGTRNSAGNQVITGVGFRSSIILFLAIYTVLENPIMSWGCDDGITHQCIRLVPTANYTGLVTTHSISLWRTAGTNLLGSVSALGADGFTITWALNGSASCEFIYICLP